MRGRRESRRGDEGFTFLELLVAMVIFGVLVGVVAGPYAAYRMRQEHVGSARELTGFLRRAQVRAVAEEATYRVDLATDGRSAQLYKLTAGAPCSGSASWQSTQLLKPSNGKLTYDAPSFVQPCGGSGRNIWFFPRGSGSKGSVRVARDGSSKTYTVNVEGLTARVSYQ